MTHDPNRPTPPSTAERNADQATDDTKPWIDADESTNEQSNSATAPTGAPAGSRQVSSASSESFDAMSQMPNADYDNIGQMNRVGMPPENNTPDSEYYETHTPDTDSNTAEPPAVRPRAMNEQAKDDVTNYTQ